MKPRVIWHTADIGRQPHKQVNGHRSFAVWFTGLSGAGKSTLAHAIQKELHALGCQVTVLDGDNVRRGLCSDLGFSSTDRHENVRRVAEVAKLFAESGFVVLAALISPLETDRKMARSLFAPGDFLEIYCDSSLAVCEQRDVKGLYKKVRAMEIPEFTGVSSPYEIPTSPELTVNTGSLSLAESVRIVTRFLHERGLLTKPQYSQGK